MWALFFSIFKVIEAAGGIVQHKQTGKYLFIYRNKKWDLPKGRIEDNEAVKTAAMREVEEETGVGNLTIIAALPTTLHLFHRNGKYRLKKTYWYAMETDHNDELVPQLEEGIQNVVWKSKDEVPELYSNIYANIKHLWEKVVL